MKRNNTLTISIINNNDELEDEFIVDDLSYKETVKLHREVWDFIKQVEKADLAPYAQPTDGPKGRGWTRPKIIPTGLLPRDTLKETYLNAHGYDYIMNNCPACHYTAIQNYKETGEFCNKCSKCMFYWGNGAKIFNEDKNCCYISDNGHLHWIETDPWIIEHLPTMKQIKNPFIRLIWRLICKIKKV